MKDSIRLRDFVSYSVISCLLLLSFLAIAADPVSVPHQFESGGDAVAADVNANFQALADAINAIPGEHSKTSSFSELSGQIDDAQIPSSIARQQDLDWSKIKSVPAGFADGEDNDSGGDITQVTVGDGLSGGGSTGDVSIELQIPMELQNQDIINPTMKVSNAVKNGVAAEFLGGVNVAGSLEVTGSLNVSGNVSGTFTGDYSGTIDVSQITGLLGQSFTMQFPDVLKNLATVEVNDVILAKDVIVVNGSGVDIEVIPGFGPGGVPADLPGVGAEHPFVFETIDGIFPDPDTDATDLKAYFDSFIFGVSNPPSMSIIIDYANGAEFERVNLFEFIPDYYEASTDGRTRFYWRQYEVPNNIMRWALGSGDSGDLFLDVGSFNPAADQKVEINNITGANFFPEVVDNPADRTLTFTFTHQEGAGIINWVRQTVILGDQFGMQSLSVIDWDGSVGSTYTNYFETFPIKFELSGYSRNTNLEASVIVKYAHSEVVPP